MSKPVKPPTLCTRCGQPVVVAPWGGRVLHNCPHGLVCSIAGPPCPDCEWDRAVETTGESAVKEVRTS